MSRDIYEIWDTESGNVLAAFPSEHDALRLIRVNVREYSPNAVRHWTLVRERYGRSTVLGEGIALAERAVAAEAEEARRASTGRVSGARDLVPDPQG